MTAATKDLAHAFLRAVSPLVATCPAAHDGTRAPSHFHPASSDQELQPVLLSGNNTAKVCQKTRESDAFMPTANPSASKKVIENKDTIR